MKTLHLETTAPFQGLPELVADAEGLFAKEGLETYAKGYGSATLRTDIDEAFLNPGNLPKKGIKYFDDTDWKWIVTGRHESREKVWQILKGK